MNSAPLIPIENIYYLFCYAWDRFEESQAIPLGGEPSPDLPNLLAKVLLGGTRTLFRRGLDRGYRFHEEEIATVRGRIDIGGSLRLRARKVQRLQCEFDELSHDIHHNRVLKASLKRLSRAPSLDRALAHELRVLAGRMADVQDIALTRSSFRRVQRHRNNAFYDFLLKVAELANDCLLPDPVGQGFRFTDVLRDERKMAGVFERFVRNFYRREQNAFAIEPLTIPWDATPVFDGSLDRLPQMRVDVFLKSRERWIIIDTKYYADALQRFYGAETYHSGNLYQLFSYLKNAAAAFAPAPLADGLLLYPQVGTQLDDRFWLQGHRMNVATVNLARPWRQIEQRLLALLEL
jgi:5-methylcytosine-specific restriction enzyme subunit McrC